MAIYKDSVIIFFTIFWSVGNYVRFIQYLTFNAVWVFSDRNNAYCSYFLISVRIILKKDKRTSYDGHLVSSLFYLNHQ